MDSTKKRERIQALATSLALQLNTLFPEGYSKDDADQDATVQSCFQNVLVANANHAIEDLKEAMPMAIEEWKMLQGSNTSSASSSNAPKSFSLLDQFGLGGGFVMVNFEEILETTSLSARLEKLKKIQYVEDILPDWKDAQAILLEGLRTTERAADGTLVAREYLGLHRKWFHDGRSSPEYLGVQYQLCCNLSKCIQELIQQQSTSSDYERQQQWLLDLIINWHQLFLDLMQRDHYVPGEISAMESTLVNLLSSSSSASSNGEATVVLLPFQILALVDPRASGFASWIYHRSPCDIVELLQRDNILSLVWERVFAMDLPHLTKDQERINNVVVRWYSLSVVTHVLMQTRVSLFPWYLLENGGSRSGETLRLQLMDRLLEEIASLYSHPTMEWKLEICYAGTETILSGIDGTELETAKDRVAKFCSRSPPVAVEVIRRIDRIVERVIACS
jgi:hypothetical protein